MCVCVCVQKEEEVVNYMVLGMIRLNTVAEVIMNKTCIDDTFSKNKLCSIPKLVTNKSSTLIFYIFFLSKCEWCIKKNIYIFC